MRYAKALTLGKDDVASSVSLVASVLAKKDDRGEALLVGFLSKH